MEIILKTEFIGREEELQQLKNLWERGVASLVTCEGRRRIGKSSLIKQFATISKADFFLLQGLSPRANQKNQDQIDYVISDMRKQMKIPPLIKVSDWSDVFDLMAQKLPEKKTVLLLDEISWMGGHDPDFPGKLKAAWDSQFKELKNCIIVLCGSVSSWINENILNNTGFVGRINLSLKIEELALSKAKKFWGNNESNISAEEKLRYMSVTGCVPRYLEEVNPHMIAEKNLERLAFTRGEILFNDFTAIFHDILSKKSTRYQQIIKTLIKGPKSFEEICCELKIQKGGVTSQYLEDLVHAGFLRRDFNYSYEGKISKFSYYRIKDNYLRFYLKYIEPNKDKIEKKMMGQFSFDHLTNWPSILGLQFENIIFNNLNKVCQLLKLDGKDILSAGPYFQKKNSKNKGACQIDLLIQTRFQNLYLCEIKFRKEIDMTVIDQVQRKIDILKRPKNFSIRPVLIYAGHLNEDVESSQYFNFIISGADLFED